MLLKSSLVWIRYKMFRLKGGSLTVAILCACVYTSAKGSSEIDLIGTKSTRCTYAYAYDMYGAQCMKLGLSKIPSLKGSIEILEFSDNKLTEIHGDTLSSYTSLKHLYLSENKIYMIEENALSSLTSLQTLDLSKNVIWEFPTTLFQLPSLRKLYLAGNPLMRLSSNLQIGRPISAQLELFDLSECQIKELPNWGYLPQLTQYNISHNPLTSLSPRHFAQMCNLQRVDLTESLVKMNPCNLNQIIQFLHEKQMSYVLADSNDANFEYMDCPDAEAASLNETYRTCRSLYIEIRNIKTSRRTWLTIGGGLFGFLVGFILLLYVMHRRNVAQTKTAAEKMKKQTNAHANNDKQGAAVLLNDIS